MTIICNVDHNLIFTGDKQTMSDDRQPIPRGWVATEPPKDAGVWQWQSTRWVKLAKYPDSPPAAPEPGQKSKEELIAELDARREKDALIALIGEIVDGKLAEQPAGMKP